MKNQNQNNIKENQAIVFESIAPNSDPVAIGELLTPEEIDAAIKWHVVLSDAAATALPVQGEFDGVFN